MSIRVQLTASPPPSRPTTADKRMQQLVEVVQQRHGPSRVAPALASPHILEAKQKHIGSRQNILSEESVEWSRQSAVDSAMVCDKNRLREVTDTKHTPRAPRLQSAGAARREYEDKLAVHWEEQERMRDEVFEGMPWWRRIVVDEAFRRRVATLAARALRLEEGYFDPAGEPQNICMPPLFRWEAMSAENRLVQPSPGAACGPLEGITHRWRGAFPPQGYVQVSPNVDNLCPQPEKTGPLQINVFVPMRVASVKSQQVHSGPDEDKPEILKDPEAAAAAEASQSGMPDKTIGVRVMEYEAEQQRKLEAEIEAKRLQREREGGGAGAGGVGRPLSRVRMELDAEGYLLLDGVRLEQRYVGTIRPSLLLLRWKIICNVLHEYVLSKHAYAASAVTAGARQRHPVAAQSPLLAPPHSASSLGSPVMSMHGSVAPSTRVTARKAASLRSVAADASPAGGSPAAEASPLLAGIPRFSFPVFRVEAQPARYHIDDREAIPRKRVEAYPPVQAQFIGLRRVDVTDARRQFLFHSPACRRALHRLFLQLPCDATSRVHKTAYVGFVLDLLHVFLPSFHAQSNVETAEDEWMCRGTPEFPDCNMFYQNFFDVPLILCRDANAFMTEELYVSVWDLLFESLHGRELLLHLYETELRDGHTNGHHSSSATSTSPKKHRLSRIGGGGDVAVVLPEEDPNPSWWHSLLPPYLNPSDPASAVSVPRRCNTDRYALHVMSQQVAQEPHMALVDPSHRVFLTRRIAAARLAQKASQSKRLVSKRSPDDDDTRLRPTGADDDYPSLSLQSKQLNERLKHPGGMLALTEKQREEARRINDMLSAENKASSLTLYEEVYTAPDLERDELDELLDYCSELSDEDNSDEDEEDDVLLQSPEDFVLGCVPNASAEGSRRADKSSQYLRSKFLEAQAERQRLEAEEARIVHRKSVAATAQQQPSDVVHRRHHSTGDSWHGTEHRQSKLFNGYIKQGVQQQEAFTDLHPGELALGRADFLQRVEQHNAAENFITSEVRNGSVDASFDDGGATAKGDMHVHTDTPEEDPRPHFSHHTDDRYWRRRHKKTSQTHVLVDDARTEKVRLHARERVRTLASQLTTNIPVRNSSSNVSKSIVPQQSPTGTQWNRQSTSPRTHHGGQQGGYTSHASYRVFHEAHLQYGQTTPLDNASCMQVQLATTQSTTRPSTSDSAAVGKPTDGPLPTLRPSTASSAHAAVTVAPFVRMSSLCRRLMSATPASATSGGTTNIHAVKGDPNVEHTAPHSAQKHPGKSITVRLQSTSDAEQLKSTRTALLQQRLTDQEFNEAGAEDTAQGDTQIPSTPQPAESTIDGTGVRRVPRTKMAPSFIAHRNQTRMRHVVGDLRPTATQLGKPELPRKPTLSSASAPPSSTVILASAGVPAEDAAAGFRKKCSEIEVTPIRPPKYRFPRFSLRKEPEELLVNGHVFPKPHAAMALVQRIHMRQVPSSSTEHPEDVTEGVRLSTSPQRQEAGDDVTPRSLGQGLPSPRVALTTHDRTILVVPTSTTRSSVEQPTSNNVAPIAGNRLAIPSS